MATRATDKREAEVMIRNAESVKIPFTLLDYQTTWMITTWVKITKMEARRIINKAYERDNPELVVTEYLGGKDFMRPKNVDLMWLERDGDAGQ